MGSMSLAPIRNRTDNRLSWEGRLLLPGVHVLRVQPDLGLVLIVLESDRQRGRGK